MRKVLYKHRNKIMNTWFGMVIAMVLVVLIRAESSVLLGEMCLVGIITVVPVMLVYSIKKK